jgi:1-acyl-sn-glycerol-3-phosphate acyltransferase
MRTILYLVMLPVSTIINGMTCIIAGLFRVPYVPGGVYDRAQRRFARWILSAAGIPVTISGAEHLAPHGPQIIVSNHASFFDILALLGYLPVHPKFIAKKELFSVPVFGGAIKASGHVRMDRGNRTQAFSAYEEAARRMTEKQLTVVVYPEGTRTLTGELLPFKKGPFVFAIGSAAPIVPCYVAGAFGIQPKGSIVVRKSAMHIMLGHPIPSTGLTPDDRDALLATVQSSVQRLKDSPDTGIESVRRSRS